jgi:hypothetical protein
MSHAHRPDDVGSNRLLNVDQFLPDYTAQHPTRQSSSFSSPQEAEISPLHVQTTIPRTGVTTMRLDVASVWLPVWVSGVVQTLPNSATPCFETLQLATKQCSSPKIADVCAGAVQPKRLRRPLLHLDREKGKVKTSIALCVSTV